MPFKPGDTITLYSKEDMRKGILQPDGSKTKIPSPNLFDSAVLSFDKSSIINHKEEIDLKSIYVPTVNAW